MPHPVWIRWRKYEDNLLYMEYYHFKIGEWFSMPTFYITEYISLSFDKRVSCRLFRVLCTNYYNWVSY
jgi:hypothetical protein